MVGCLRKASKRVISPKFSNLTNSVWQHKFGSDNLMYTAFKVDKRKYEGQMKNKKIFYHYNFGCISGYLKGVDQL